MTSPDGGEGGVYDRRETVERGTEAWKERSRILFAG